ncbi:MAG: HesA/MoeB/ThiF family protein [Oscillospiraceae bacterium]|nr:HesA/MoeB/ThiF family protein [Oscillospiraceae bacterium]
MKLTDKQEEIFSRQILMKSIGEEGQLKLLKAKVLVVGCGGLGAPVLLYLTAMGIGHLGLCDNDTVALSNLNRQVLFTPNDVGKSKALTAQKQLKTLNPTLDTTVYNQTMDEKLAKSIVQDYDIVLDCLDNFDTRFVLGDACLELDKPLIHAGVDEFYGQLMTIIPGKSPCLRCLFPDGLIKEKRNKTFGIIGTTPAILGSMQAMEAAKLLLGLDVFTNGLITYDGLEQTLDNVTISAVETCLCKIYGVE